MLCFFFCRFLIILYYCKNEKNLIFYCFLFFFMFCNTISTVISLNVTKTESEILAKTKNAIFLTQNQHLYLKKVKKRQKMTFKKTKSSARSMGCRNFCRNFCDKIHFYLKNFGRNFCGPQKFLRAP